MKNDFYTRLSQELVIFLHPLAYALKNPDQSRLFMQRIGWSLPKLLSKSGQDIQVELNTLQKECNQLISGLEHSPSLNAAELIHYLRRFQSLRETINSLQDKLNITDFPGLAALWIDLRDYLLQEYLAKRLPQGFALARLLRIIDAQDYTTPESFNQLLTEENSADLARMPFWRLRFRYDQLDNFFRNPLNHLQSIVLPINAQDNNRLSDFFHSARYLLATLSAPHRFGSSPYKTVDYGDGGNDIVQRMLTMLFERSNGEKVGLSFTFEDAPGGKYRFVAIPFGINSADDPENLDGFVNVGNWKLRWHKTRDLAVFRLGGGEVEAIKEDGSVINAFDLGFIALLPPLTEELPALRFGDKGSSHLSIGSIQANSSVGWNGNELDIKFGLGMFNGVLELADLITITWKELFIELGRATSVKLDGKELPFRFGVLQTEEATHFLVVQSVPSEWLATLFHHVSPNLFKDSFENLKLDLSILFNFKEGNAIREIRADFTSTQENRFELPGVSLDTPKDLRSSLVFGGKGRDLTDIAWVIHCKQDQSFDLTSSFAFERSGERELHNEPDKPGSKEFLKLKIQADSDQSLCLAKFKFKGLDELPRFFEPVERYVPTMDETPTGLTDFNGSKFQGWSGTLTETSGLRLPFLSNDQTGQHLQVKLTNPKIILQDADAKGIVTLDITLTIGSLALSLETGLEINLNTFSLMLGDQQLALNNSEPQLKSSLLGMEWRFIGQESGSSYHYFDLHVSDSNYRISQAKGCRLELEYRALGDEPIVFVVEDFFLSEAGVNLSATVSERPARLNGLNTRFTFSNSSFKIIENQIQAFSLSGSGPLPPDLVGDAKASITLQFKQEDNRLKLDKSDALLEGKKLLECHGTHFNIALHKLGLKFHQEADQFHLYFLITGQASYQPSAKEADGALALLGGIHIDLVDCPLAGDASVLASHINFVIALPKPVEFKFLSCFAMEIRGIGFIPNTSVFGKNSKPVAAMKIAGQVSFGDGGDQHDPNDPHRLYIGLPKPGELLPQVKFEGKLPLRLSLGEAFKLEGSVEQVDEKEMQGFRGAGSLEVQGMKMSGSFGFMRVRRLPDGTWLRAWFIFVQVEHISYPMPVVSVYLREVGLGFGYRYTLAMIQAADQTNDIGMIIATLRKLSLTQGNLANMAAWQPDIEEIGTDPRWTLVMRGLIAQSTAASSPLDWSPTKEEELACLFLFDAVMALRSDLTFLMTVRAWLNTNYFDFTNDDPAVGTIRNNPLFNGFVLLSPRKSRLLAHMASNPNGYVGSRPALPGRLGDAFKHSQVSATLLMEPGLTHAELGWPNQLRWSDKIGSLEAEITGGMVVRNKGSELVYGQSIAARAKLDLAARADLGFVGAEIRARADVAYGARQIGVVNSNEKSFAIYSAMAVEARVEFSVNAWICLRIKIFGKKIELRKNCRFSTTVGFTAALELGGVGYINSPKLGLRGRGAVAIQALGHTISLSVNLDANPGAVAEALAKTQQYLDIGLEARDIGDPGLLPKPQSNHIAPVAAPLASPTNFLLTALPSATFQAVTPLNLEMPDYIMYVFRGQDEHQQEETTWHFILLPKGETTGFLPAPPNESEASNDFILEWPLLEGVTVQRFNPANPSGSEWENCTNTGITWKAGWDEIVAADNETSEPVKLRTMLQAAYIIQGSEVEPDYQNPSPVITSNVSPTADSRLHHPTESCYESAVLRQQAVGQFRGSPLFKLDPTQEYDRLLMNAFDSDLPDSQNGAAANQNLDPQTMEKGVRDVRGMLIQDIVADVRDFLGLNSGKVDTKQSIAFQMGLVFRIKGAKEKFPKWLKEAAQAGELPTLRQRLPKTEIENVPAKPLILSNPVSLDFRQNPPSFDKVVQFSDANTIAIGWELKGNDPALDIEHHVAHYEIYRRHLGEDFAERVYTTMPVCIVGKDETGERLLLPHFGLVEHFNHESLAEQATLPANGLQYLYSITPVSYAGERGQPLTLVVTRYPDQAPLVPVDGKLKVCYRLDPNEFKNTPETLFTRPKLLALDKLMLEWTEPQKGPNIPEIAVEQYYLVFRKSQTVAVGSYGLDGEVQSDNTKYLPTSNALRNAEDISIDLEPYGPVHERRAELKPDKLAGVFSKEDGLWQPQAWRVYLQTEGVNGVLSALVPVQLVLQFDTDKTSDEKGIEPEERHVAEIEWLPHPFNLPWVRTEDGKAQDAIAFVPMPSFDAIWGGSAPDIPRPQYLPHPGGKRFMHLRWNRGPHSQRGYPKDLPSSFIVYQFDADAHSQEVFKNPLKQALFSALKPIGEANLMEAEDLAITPNNTQSTTHWEAWYPSALQRDSLSTPNDQMCQARLKPIQLPWHSWRDSCLLWPDLPNGCLTKGLHPLLSALIEKLSADYFIQVQSPPPRPKALDQDSFLRDQWVKKLLEETPVAQDPFGWGALQRMGLSTTLAFRNLKTHALQTPDFGKLRSILSILLEHPDFETLKKNLHIELLFKPSQAFVAEEPAEEIPSLLLYYVQISLRPCIEQVYFYLFWEVKVEGDKSFTLVLDEDGDEGRAKTLIIQRQPSGKSADGTLTLNPKSEIVKKLEQVFTPTKVKGGNQEKYAKETISVVMRAKLKAKESIDQMVAKQKLSVIYEDLTIESQDTTRKTLDFADINRRIALFENPEWTPDETQFQEFTNYATFPKVFPEDAAWDKNAAFDAYLEWSGHFFDHGGKVSQGKTEDGPWMATAYPKPTTPSQLAYQKGKPLEYGFLLPDLWAHNYRFYIQPINRYQRLWQSLFNSPLFKKTKALESCSGLTDPLAGLDPNACGIDCAVERHQPIDPPIILSSKRLDVNGIPGSTWEVIVAKHGEQRLSEHNTTSARRLGSLSFPFKVERELPQDTVNWLDRFSSKVNSRYFVPDNTEDDLTMIEPISPSLEPAKLAANLPDRLGSFQQEALVVHWDNFPYYYEHRFSIGSVVSLRDSSIVSETNQIIQGDFEYCAPEPLSIAFAADVKTPGIRPLVVRIALGRYWDCLPKSVQDIWTVENPKRRDGDKRPVAAFPEPKVVYQLIETFSGNTEVQLELALDVEEEGDLIRPRQVTNRYETEACIVIEIEGRQWMEFQLSMKETMQTYNPEAAINTVMVSTLPNQFAKKTQDFSDRVQLKADGTGKGNLSFSGYMSLQEYRIFQELFKGEDLKKIKELFALSINQGLQGRKLQLRTGLGSAKHSSLTPLVTTTSVDIDKHIVSISGV